MRKLPPLLPLLAAMVLIVFATAPGVAAEGEQGGTATALADRFQPVDTERLMVHAPHGWAGYTYVYNDDQSEAELLDRLHALRQWIEQMAK